MVSKCAFSLGCDFISLIHFHFINRNKLRSGVLTLDLVVWFYALQSGQVNKHTPGRPNMYCVNRENKKTFYWKK